MLSAGFSVLLISPQDISIAEYVALTPYQRLCLLLADATDATLLDKLKHIAFPLLTSLQEGNEGGDICETAEGVDLLSTWLVDMAKQERLNWCYMVIHESRPSSDNPPHLRVFSH